MRRGAPRRLRSDYPHWDCEYPDSVRAISKRRGLSQESKDKILGANAQRLYGSRLSGNIGPRANGARNKRTAARG